MSIMPVSPESLTALTAKQDITEAIYKYCKSMDKIDRALGLSLWHADGTVDYGELFPGKTGADFIAWVSDVHETMVKTSHQMTNILIDLTGDTATSESWVTAVLRMEVEGVMIDRVIRGRYLDRWSKREGRWALDHRKYDHDFDHDYPLVATD
jgi:hypothetical protein